MQIRQIWAKTPTFVALLAIITSSLVAIDAAPASAAIVTSNLVYNLDANDTTSLAASSPTTWNSVAPGSNTTATGTLVGNVSRGTTGSVSYLNFDGTGDGVVFPAGTGRTPGSMTYETWINVTTLPNAGAWGILATRWFNTSAGASTGGADQDWHFGIYNNAGTIKLRLDTNANTGTATAAYSAYTPVTNAWALVGFQYTDAGQIQFYVNGQPSGTPQTTTHVDSATAVWMVGDARAASVGLVGKISKVRLYSAALTATQMAQNYTADAATFGLTPTNTGSPVVTGRNRIGATLATTDGSWIGDNSGTSRYKWQSSPDGTTWTDISGATSSTYTTVAGDAGNVIRSVVTRTTSAGSTSANSGATAKIASANYFAIPSGGKLTGFTSTVPNDSNTYNVTLYSSGLAGTMNLGTTTGLTFVSGYSTSASVMATSFVDSSSIVSFRGTGTAINTALANVTYYGTVGNNDTVKLYYSLADSTATGTRNYIPIYDNGQLTFHYYTYKTETTGITRAALDTKLATLGTTDGVQASVWYAVTTRYQIEWQRYKDLIGSVNGAFLGSYAWSGSSNWYWPANTDGYATATQFSTGSTGSNNLFNGTSTVQPWVSGEPNSATTTDRVGYTYVPSGGSIGWDDTPPTTTSTNWIAETYATTPYNTGSLGAYTATVRVANLAGAPTGLTASAPATSVTLNWTAPASTGTDTLSDYVIQYSTDGQTWTDWAHTASTATSATITGLTASTVYTFRVAGFTTDTGAWSTPVKSSAGVTTGTVKSLSGYSIPTSTTGTIRVLIATSNANGRLWVTDTGITTGVRGTANSPEDTGYTPTNGYRPATINTAGQMIGLSSTSATAINTALATLKYQSTTAATDTISMWVSNGSDYVALMNAGNVEFHYYGYSSTTATWANARTTSYAAAAQSIDGVTLAAGTSYLATLRYRAENLKGMALVGTNQAWFAAADYNTVNSGNADGAWYWYGPDVNNNTGVQFWNGGTSGTSVNGEYQDWNFNSSNALTEPNGLTSENCLGTNGGGSSTGPVAAYGWNDYSCATAIGYLWEASNTGVPFGANTTSLASANFASLYHQQQVTMSTPPAAPTALIASSSASGQVDLSWTAPAGVTGITSYSVQYSTDGVNWTEHRGTAGTATTESFTGLTPKTYYQFKVAVIVGSSVGNFTNTYYTPTGTGQTVVVYGGANAVNNVSIDSSLATYKVSVLLRTSNMNSTYGNLSLGTVTNLGGIRGTANYATLTASGQMIGLTGLGSDVNTALATLKFNSAATAGSNTISMWVSVGTTTALPQAYVPIVNSAGQVDFHYFGASTTENGTWFAAQTKAANNSATINGQTVSGKFLATADTAEQLAMVGDLGLSADRYWLNGGDYNAVSSSNADGAWYWMGQDTGFQQFWSGDYTGSGIAGTYFNWGATSSTVKQEPNGGTAANCTVAVTGSVYTYNYSGTGTTGNLNAISNTNGVTMDDYSCAATDRGYIWEYVSSTPVGSTTLGSNYEAQSAISVALKPAADAPTNVAMTSISSTSAIVTWTPPTVNVGSFSFYRIDYSTDSTFATGLSYVLGPTALSGTSALITGLTSGSTYYTRVFVGTATPSFWGAYSSSASAVISSTATTITIVASGGGTAGTDYALNNGNFYPINGSSVSINASAVQASLGSVATRLAADNVIINAPITWSTATGFTLGNDTSSTVTINKGITASSNSSSFTIAPATYSLDVKNGASVQLTSSGTQYLNIGGSSFTIIKTEAQLVAAATATTNYAIGKPLSLATSYTASPVAISGYSGIFDGLGNTIDGLKIAATAGGGVGLIQSITTGAKVRNLGVTNIANTIGTYTGAMGMGGVVGNSGGGTLEQVWATGSIKALTGSTVADLAAGGLLGNAFGGTTTIKKSWTRVNIDTSTVTFANMTVGGILGGDVTSYGQANTTAGGNVSLSQVYSLGDLKVTTANSWHAVGGLVGLHYSTGTLSISDGFSWANIARPGDTNNFNYGGLVGVASGGTTTASNLYTSFSNCTDASQAAVLKTCTNSVVPGSSVSAMTGGNWATDSTYGTYLTALAPPVKQLYVQVVAPTDGSYATMTDKVVDANGTTQTLSALNLSSSGTPVYSILSNTARGTFNVNYVSGYTFAGTAIGANSISAWPTATSVTITRLPQTFTWTPTTALSFGSGTVTPTAPSSSASSTITYAVSNAGTTGCSVNAASGVITYTNAGSCAITATAAATVDYTGASVTVTFVISEPAAAPSVTASAASNNSVLVSWAAPTVNATSALTGYQIYYANNVGMAGATMVTSTKTSRIISGLTAGTTYYFQVRAVNGTTWYGTLNGTPASSAPTASATTITVVASGGGVAGTDYKISNGIITAVGTSASINVADIQSALLTNDVFLASDNVVINAPITWSTSQLLTLGTSTAGSVAINASLNASGVSAGLAIATATYAFPISTGNSIQLSGSSSTLSMGGNAYTLIRAIGDLSSVTTTGYYALAKPLTFGTTALTASPIPVDFTGTFDGLGNTLDGMVLTVQNSANAGLFTNLSAGSTVRNLGITNVNISIPTTASTQAVVGVLAGGVPTGISGTITVNKVWTSGFIRGAAGTYGNVAAAGLIAWVRSGTLNVSQSWSSINVDASSMATTNIAIGGLVGTDCNAFGQNYTLGGANLSISESYFTGNLKTKVSSWRGTGGILGLHYDTSTVSLTDVFSAGVVTSTDTNNGGVYGVVYNGTITIQRAFTTSAYCGDTGTTNCLATGVALGATVSGANTALWTNSGASYLVNLPAPKRNVYVQVLANTDGSYGTIGYQYVDGFGAATTLASLSLTATGSPTYNVTSSTAVSATPYNVNYVSGITLGGTSAPYYSLLPYGTATAITISKLAQTITWNPTTAVSFGSGSITPSALPVASGGTAITYGVTDAGTTGCTVNSTSGVITATYGGSCVITASAANSGNYLGASVSATFVISNPATTPTGLAAVTAGSGTLNIGWTAPSSVSSSVALTGYTLLYSTSSSMTSPTTVNVGATTGYLLTGLTSGTTYYFQVRAVGGSAWQTPYTAVSSATPNSTATTINVVASGGGVAGTDFTIYGGVISTTGTASINASDIATVLAAEGTVQLAASTVNINGAVSWSSNATLILGNTSAATVNVNSTITASGNTAGIKLLPTTYSLAVKSGAYIRLTGTSPTFNLGGTGYTVVNTVGGLSSVTASTNWVLGAPISLTASYTASVLDMSFAGTLDGLGNTVNNMQIAIASNANAGFFTSLGGATVRNIGFTNVNISSTSAAVNVRLGAVAGNGSAAGTNTVTAVWSTGFIVQNGNTSVYAEVGGLFGGATAGTLNISKSWSSVAITTYAASIGSGGIIGTNVSTFGGGSGSGNALTISESYSTGNILRNQISYAWYGNGGIIGVAYGLSTTLTNVFSWGNINSTGGNSGTSTAGISGVGTATITNAYATYSSCGGSTVTNCVASATAGALVAGTGMTSGVWQSTNGTSLVNVALPTKSLYVQVIAPTDGSYGTMSYQIVDSTGTVQTLSSLSLTISGTPTYTIASNVAKGSYSVAYSNGLTLGGSSAGVYSLSAWKTNTAVTISAYNQTVTWAPTTSIAWNNGTFTPDATPSALGTPTFTYAVGSAGTTGCTVNPTSGVVTYTAGGTCSINLTATATDYVTVVKSVTFTIAASPTFTIVASGGGTLGTDYTISGGALTAASGANVSINSSDLNTALASGSVKLYGNVVVNAAVSWSSNSVLTLGSATVNTVSINAAVIGSGTSSGVVISPTSYALDVKAGGRIQLPGTSSTLSIGGTSYTLVRSEADLTAMTATGNYALAAPITYATALSNKSAIDLNFTGNLDGLGNTVSGVTTTVNTAGSYGFIKQITGATIRNLGVLNFVGKLNTYTGNMNFSAFAGTASGGTLDQIWTTGSITATSGISMGGIGIGGLIGVVNTGATTINKSWSTVNIDLSGASAVSYQALGGLVGGDFYSYAQSNTASGGNLTMTQVYATGSLYQATGATWVGTGGLLGLHWSTATLSITDAFSWGKYVGYSTDGGIIGVAGGAIATVTRAYAVTGYVYNSGSGVVSVTNGYVSQVPGTAVSGLTGSNWGTANGSTLVNLPTPQIPLFVQVVAPTDGSYGTMSYQVVNVAGTAQTLSSLNLSVSGTPTYSLASNAANGTYSVLYTSGLTLGGSAVANYSLSIWPTATSVTISKQPQTISFTSTIPATPKTGQTYTVTATATSALAVAFTIDASSQTVCSITGSTVTFNTLGTCTINANQAGSTGYTAAAQVQQAITVAKGPQTISFTSTAPAAAKYAGAGYTPTATGGGSGNAVTFTIDSSASTVCAISAGVVTYQGVGTCVINANQAGSTNFDAASQAQQSFTVGKAAQTVTVTSTAPATAVVGGATYTVTATGGGSANAVTFAVDATASLVCSISGAVVSFLTAGTCLINANQAGSDLYAAATQYQQSFNVGKGTQTVAFTNSAPINAKANGATYTVAVTPGVSTGAVTVSVDAASVLVCSVSGYVVSYLSVGNCVLNLNQAGDANYTAAAQVQQTIGVTSNGMCPFGSVQTGGYCLFQFNSNGTFTVPAGITSVDILTVGGGGAGGGGGGGNGSGGGGGAGEVIDTIGRAVTPGTVLTATIGAGGVGSGGAATYTPSNPGASTTVTGSGFSTITSRGGGQGGAWNFTTSLAMLPGTGATVAGGGGAFGQTTSRTAAPSAGGVSTGGNGYGDNSVTANQAGGGGGGATGNGADALIAAGGTGGAGKTSTITGASYGGGGGGGKRSTGGSAGSATAGGGAGGLGGAGTAGTANTGGGGGGSGGSSNGANGGSGFVAIRFAMTSQTISYTSTAPTTMTFGGSDTYTPAATGGSSGNEVTFTIDASSSAVCSISNGAVSAIGAGTCTVNANQLGTGYIASAAQVQQSFTILKQSQSISFTSTAPSNAVVAGTTYTPTATGGGSGNSVTFTVSGTCSIASGVVSFTAAGTCTVKADQATNTNYAAATQVTQSITVGKGTQTISFTSTAPAAAKVGGSTYTASATGGASGSAVTFSIDSSSTSICSISGAVVSFTAVGTCKVNADQLGSANYNAATQAQQSFSVAKGAQTISITSTAPSNAVVDGSSYTISATGGNSGSSVTFSIDATASAICSISGAVVSFTAVGTCKVNADQLGSANYNAATQVQQSFSVAKGAQSITITSTAPTTAVVDGSSYTVTATGGASGNSVTFTATGACTVSSGTVSFTSVGTCTLSANQAGSTNYNAAAQVQQSFAVGKGAQTISFTTSAPAGAVVAGSTYTPTATGGASGNSVVITASGACAIALGIVSFTSAGTCTVTANQAGTSNYVAATALTQSFSVGKGTQTISFTSTTPTAAKVGGTGYTPAATGGATGNSVTFTVDSGSASVCEISAGVVTFLAVGSCKVNADQAGNANYNAASASQTFTVAKGSQNITITSTAPASAKVDGANYNVTATGGASGKSVTFSIDASSQTVCTITGFSVSFHAAGTCKVNANQDGSANYDAAAQASQNITVAKGSQTINFTSTAPNAAVVDGNGYTPAATGGASGNSVTFDASGACSIVGGVVSFDSAGNCTVTANQSGNDNYDAAAYASQTITVGKGSQTISFTTAQPSSPVVAGAVYMVGATGGASGNSVTFTASGACIIAGAKVSFVAAGTCTITANQAGSADYNAAAVATQSFTVGKGIQVAEFTSTVPNNAVVDGLGYSPTATGGDSGKPVTFSIDAASTLICHLNAGQVSFDAVGDCVVHANQAGTANWQAASQVTQIITVGKGSQAIVFTSTAPNTAIVAGASYTVSATGGATGASIDFSIDAAAATVCEINSGVVTFNNVGICTVLANQAGNDNYLDAEQVSQSFEVGKGNQVILFTSSAPQNAVVAGSGYTPNATGGATANSVEFTIAAGSATICSISNGDVSFNAVGDCVIEANQLGDDRFNEAGIATQTISVAKGTQTISFTTSAPAQAKVGGASYAPAVSDLGTEGSVAFSVDAASSAICSVDAGGNVSFTAVGTCKVLADQLETANFNAAAQVSQSFEVLPGVQVISFSTTAPNNAVVDGATYSPEAVGGDSGRPVVLSIAPASASICELNNGEVSFFGSGDCTIHANQDGNDNYTAATQVTQTVVVGKGSQTVAFTSEATNPVVGGSTYTPSATGGASGNAVTFHVDLNATNVCAITSGVIRFLGVGTCVLKANQQGNANYNAAPAAVQSFAVAKGSQVISFTSAAPTAAKVGGASYLPTATGGATGNNVTFAIDASSLTVCSLVSGKVTFDTPGDCVINANQAGNTNYNAADQTSQTFTVYKGVQNITFVSSAPAGAKVSGTGYQPVAVGGDSNNDVTFSVHAGSETICTVDAGVVQFNAVGNCVIEANQAGNNNFEDATAATQTISVAKGLQSLMFTSTPPSHAQVATAMYTPAATGGPSGVTVVYTVDPLAASKCAINNGVVTFQSVGNCIVHADQAGNANYRAATTITQIFDVTKGPQSISFTSTAPPGATVEGAAYTVAAAHGAGTAPVTYSVSELATDICTVTGDQVSFLAAGTCIVLADEAGDANYNAANTISQSFEVGKGNQAIDFTASATSATVDGGAYTPTFSRGHSINPVVISVDGTSSDVCEVVSGSVVFHQVGICNIAADQDGDQNYNAATTIYQSISVARGNQAAVTAHSSVTNLVLGDQSPTAVVSLSGGSGTGGVTWTVASDSTDYCSVEGDVVTGLSLGICNVIGTKAEDDNYFATSDSITLTISNGGQTPVQLSVNDPAPTFAADLALTMTLDGGSGEGAVWFETQTPHVCNTDGTATLNILHAGTCTVVGHKDGDSNFTEVADTLTFDIAKASQGDAMVTLSHDLTYNATTPDSADIGIDGAFTEGTTRYAVTDGDCTIDSGKLVAGNAGSCSVTATIEGDENYLPATVVGSFDVAQAVQTELTATLTQDSPASVAWEGVNETSYSITGGEGDGELSATTTTADVCSVSVDGTVLHVTGLTLGTCEVELSKDSSDNYLAASTIFNLNVLDLPASVSDITMTSGTQIDATHMDVAVGWLSSIALDTEAAVTGYLVQTSTDGTTWTNATAQAVAANLSQADISVRAWSKVFVRVAPTSALDGSDLTKLHWTNFNLDGGTDPATFDISGALTNMSTNLAAASSGETVVITGTGFDPAVTTQVELNAAASIFGARFGIGAAGATLTQTKRVPATVISDTKLSFVLPVITLPKGVTRLSTTIKVLANNGIESTPVPLEYIPKKLTQTLSVTPALPTVAPVLVMPSVLQTNFMFTSTGAEPEVTATPADVCLATLDVNHKLVVTPVSPGTCSISVVAPGTPGYLVSAAKTVNYTIKSSRTPVLTLTASDILANGTAGSSHSFTAASTLLTPGAINAVIGNDPMDLLVALSARQGTLLFTVAPADEAAGRCTADGGDASSGLFASITLSDIGDCHVTVTQPADSGWFVGETIHLVVHTTARPSDVVVIDNGDGVTSNEDTAAAPDADSQPATMITMTGNAQVMNFGDGVGVDFDPVTGIFKFRMRTGLVGTWKVTMTNPNSTTQKWFKNKSKVVKKVQQYVQANNCTFTLVVKKDPKLKKAVMRQLGSCQLNDFGKAAFQLAGFQKLKARMVFTRQYAKTGLPYVKQGTAKVRVLAPTKRTFVFKVGRG